MISETMTVGEVAAAIPSSVRVLQRHGLDFCCGGRRPIGEACREHGLSFADLAEEIAIPCAHVEASATDWTRAPLPALIDHIVATYHDALREDLPRLSAMAGKVLQAHGGKAGDLGRLETIVTALSADLLDHMRKEELLLFPVIRALEGAGPRDVYLGPPIAALEQEHDRAGELLAELRRITSDYTPPSWACATVRALYQGLEELETSMHVHVHLENNVLFPRAQEISARYKG